MKVDREALREAQTPAYTTVYAADGTFAGLVWPSRWECASCLAEGWGGRLALLAHDAEHEAGAA